MNRKASWPSRIGGIGRRWLSRALRGAERVEKAPGPGEYAGRCGVYRPVKATRSIDPITPTERDAFAHEHWPNLVYHCLCDDGRTMTLAAHRALEHRVDSDGFEVVASTSFYLGDAVTVGVGSRRGQAAVIHRTEWHRKRQRIVFHLRFGDEISSRWYWEEDLQPVERGDAPA